MGNEEVDLISVSKPGKKTLLERYNIPIDNLSYEFISECTNVKTLERIILILRSGEEGIYPDLTKHAEERLAAIKPNSAILRKAVPVLRPNMLNLDERQEINSEINSWTSEMRSCEKDLSEGKITLINGSYPQPEIRKTNLHIIKENEKTRISDKPRDKSKRISSCDYAAWDKYDADTEVNRIDLQDEQQQSKMKRIQERRKELVKANRITPEMIIDKLSLTGTELNVTAEEERKKGNESFKAADYQEALQHYNISITINSNPLAYNNRAMTFIKLQRYEDAIRDCNTVLSMDCNNVKAYLRRALCLENLEKSQQALADYEAVLRLEPINKTAISGVQKLRKPCKSKSIRMKIQEGDMNDSEDKIEQLRSENTIETNDIKYSKQLINNDILCYCDRAPSSSRNVTVKPHVKTNYCVEIQTGKDTANTVTNKSNEKITNFFPAYDKSSITVRDLSNVNKISKSQDIAKEDDIPIIHCESFKTRTDYTLKKSIFSCTSLPYKRKASTVIIEELPNTEMYEESNKVINPIKPKMEIKEETNLKLIENTTKVYEDKNKESIYPEKKEKIQTNVMSENVQMMNNCQKGNDIFKIDTKKLDNVESPYEFLRIWQSLKNDTDLKSHARLLRSIAYEDMNKIIGYKLDATMFSLILRCLEQQFCTAKDTVLIADILLSLSQLKRFSIVYMFMDSKDKKALENILYFLEEQNSPQVSELRQIYII